jgi:hypothetical protein
VYAPYIILFLLVLLIFLIISDYKFDQVFDVMLHTVSPPRRVAASPPSPRCRYSIKAVTRADLMLHFGPCSYRDNPTLFFSGRVHFQEGRWTFGKDFCLSLRRFMGEVWLFFESFWVPDRNKKLPRTVWYTLGTAEISTRSCRRFAVTESSLMKVSTACICV